MTDDLRAALEEVLWRELMKAGYDRRMYSARGDEHTRTDAAGYVEAILTDAHFRAALSQSSETSEAAEAVIALVPVHTKPVTQWQRNDKERAEAAIARLRALTGWADLPSTASEPRDIEGSDSQFTIATLDRADHPLVVKDGIGHCQSCGARGEVATPDRADPGTLTECPIDGVHEHAFRGPHRFREWDPDRADR